MQFIVSISSEYDTNENKFRISWVLVKLFKLRFRVGLYSCRNIIKRRKSLYNNANIALIFPI
jgi:hypothetical protein